MKHQIFLKKQNILLPTLCGWVLIFIILFSVFFSLLVSIHSFLAINKPVDSKVLIVEGWLPDYAFEKVTELYKTNNIKTIFVTGGPLESGSYLKEFKNYAALGGATLKALSIPDSEIFIVPAPLIKKDRTFTSAIALKAWLHNKNIRISDANIVTLGVHARRSKILFTKVFNMETKIGVISIENHNYPPKKWFTYSEGFKTVIMETISYCYTKLFFSK